MLLISRSLFPRMAEASENECDQLVMDTSSKKQASDSSHPENFCAEGENLNESCHAELENNVQACIVAAEMKDSESKTTVITTENEENKSVFLKAIELSPCQQGIKTLSHEKAEGNVSKTESVMRGEMMIAENENNSFVDKDKEGNDSETDPLESNKTNDHIEQTETDGQDNSESVVKGNDIKESEIEDLQIVKLDENSNSKPKDVHFSSPLVVVHEYKYASQVSCSQSTVNLSNLDNSQTLDDDVSGDEGLDDKNNEHINKINKSLSKVSDVVAESDAKKAVATITPGGDCFSVQVNESIDCEKEIPSKELSQDAIMNELVDKTTETVVLESENNDQLRMVPIVKEDKPVKSGKESSAVVLSCALNSPLIQGDQDTSTYLITQEKFSKQPLPNMESEYVLKASKEMFSEELIKPLNTDKSLATNRPKESCLEKNDRDELRTEISQSKELEDSPDLFMSSSDQTVVVYNESEKEKETTQICKHVKSLSFSEQEYEAPELTDRDVDEIIDNKEELSKEENVVNDLKENEAVKDNSQNDLFDSAERIVKSDNVSELSKKSNNEPEKDLDDNKDKLIKESFVMMDSSQKDLFDSDSVYSDRMAEEREKANDKEMAIDINSIQNKGINPNLEDSSQKDLFGSDISSENISCTELQIITYQEDMKGIQNMPEVTNITHVEDPQKCENKEEMITETTSSPEKDTVGMNMEHNKDNEVKEDTGAAKIFYVGVKRKADEHDENQSLKSFKLSDAGKQVLTSSFNTEVIPRKRHSLFKNSVVNETEHPAKRAKSSEPDSDLSETETMSPILPIGIKTLAEIASDVINSLEEDLIWKHEISDKEADHKIRSKAEQKTKDENSEVMKSKVSIDSQNLVTKLESDNNEVDTNIAYHTSGVEYNMESKESVELETDTIADSNMATEENSVVPALSPNHTSEAGQSDEDTIRNEIAIKESQVRNSPEQVTGSPGFVSALEYHSQCSQNSSTGFEPKTFSQDIVMSSQGSDHSVPIICGKDVHSVTEVYEEGIETTDLNKTGKNVI